MTRWPLLGDLPAFRRDRLALLAACGRAGDVARLRLGPWRAHVLSHPALVRAVLVEQQEAFTKSPALRAARTVLGDGLLTSEGEIHRRHRRLVQAALGRSELEGLGACVERHAARVTRHWSDGDAVDVLAAARDLTLGVAAETVFGRARDVEADVLSAALDELLDAYESPLLPVAAVAPWLPLPRLRRWRRARARIDGVVRARTAPDSTEPAGVARTLLEARDGLAPPELHDELVTLLLAGHETSASALAWTCWLVASDPVLRERVEAESGTEAGGRWTRAAVSEALRLYPPSWAMGRQARRAVVVGGHAVEGGDLVIVSQWVVQRDPRWWPRPEAFDPARWIDGRAEQAPAFAYFPFGGGRRRCVGEPMAWTGAVTALAALTRGWRLEPAPGPAPVPRALLTLRPGGPVRLAVRRRPPAPP